MGEIEEVVLEHAVLNSDLSDPANGPTAMKHIRQQVKSCSKYSIRIFILATYVYTMYTQVQQYVLEIVYERMRIY